ncbi:MAG: glycosyltransferase family 2 protein [Candidatus Magasanikbacteria bacterium]|nr:glycosyltransferase family 2 protein [Candidatus Magasanikbacteria bacterium]
MQKLSVHLIAWNGAKYIQHLFESLRQQTCKDWFLYIVDNDSEDNTVELIKKELENFDVPHKLVINSKNEGFAGGHNQVYRDTNSEYFLLLNQDMYLQPDCLQNMIDFLDTHTEVGAVSPRLMKWDFAKVATDGLEKSLSNQIDALGLKVFRNRRMIEQYTQYDWNEIKNNFSGSELEVFGASGAFPMMRRSIIDKVAFSGGQFLDETYHVYKEDVDLSYRLQEAGYKSFILLNTVAHHDRGGAGPKEMNDFAAAANKKKQTPWVQYHSYKNHIRTLYKNEYWQNLILDLPWILWYELKKLVYYILFDRKVLSGLKEVWQGRDDLKNKREQINKMKTADWQDLRKWWK